MNIGRFLPYFVLTLLALAVLLPLLSPGFILTLDMVFTPTIRVPAASASSFLFYAILHLLNIVVPGDVLEKIVLFVILFFSGMGMYHLFRYASDRLAERNEIGAYIASALYMINPYTYDRFMAGQFAVLLGYALLPFLFVGIMKLIDEPTLLHGIFAGVILAIIGIVSIHTLGLAAILIITSMLLAVWQYRHMTSRLIKTIQATAVSAGTFFVTSYYWIVPMLTGNSTAAKAIAGFSARDNAAFATIGSGLIGKLIHIARLQGFWAESTGEFSLPQAHLPGWGSMVIVLWVFILIGAIMLWRRDKRFIVIVLLISAGIGALLAAGNMNGAASNIVLLRGFREPDKFVGLVALAYAFFAGNGINDAYLFIGQFKQRILQQGSLIIMCLLPILITPTMFWGFGGQLNPRQYPLAWQAMNQRLDADHSSFKILFLPWHLYMYFGFADRIIMNPAPNYFDKPVLSSNDPEFGGASPDRPDRAKTLLTSHILPSAPHGTTFGSTVAPLGIKYILLDKDNDYTAYAYLDHQHDLRLVEDNATFKLYRNLAYRGKP